MKKRSVLLILLSLVLALSAVLSGCSPKQETAAQSAKVDETITLRLAHEDPADNQWGVGALHFAELVEQKTNGKVKIQVYDNGQLGHGVDNIQQLQTNTLELTIVGSDLVLVDTFFKFFDLPYLFRDREHAKAVLSDASIIDACDKVLNEHNLVLLGFWENGFRQITNSKHPVVEPKDLAGLKIRVPENDVRVAMFKAYGADPTAMAFSELYTSLQQGIIDAQENPYGNIWGDKLFEVQKYISRSNHVFTPINVLISKDCFDGLSPEYQKALREAAVETTAWQIDWAASQEDGWIQDMVDYGCEFSDIDLDAFVAASQPIWDSVVSECGPEVSDIIEKIKQY